MRRVLRSELLGEAGVGFIVAVNATVRADRTGDALSSSQRDAKVVPKMMVCT
jgi:hypothetical protein